MTAGLGDFSSAALGDDDGDGFSNIAEVCRGTSEIMVDSDGDGYSDSVDSCQLTGNELWVNSPACHEFFKDQNMNGVVDCSISSDIATDLNTLLAKIKNVHYPLSLSKIKKILKLSKSIRQRINVFPGGLNLNGDTIDQFNRKSKKMAGRVQKLLNSDQEEFLKKRKKARKSIDKLLESLAL